MRSQQRKGYPNVKSRDLVEELIGDGPSGIDDHHTHQPEETRDILNDLVLDRGPNPSKPAPSQPDSHAISKHEH